MWFVGFSIQINSAAMDEFVAYLLTARPFSFQRWQTWTGHPKSKIAIKQEQRTVAWTGQNHLFMQLTCMYVCVLSSGVTSFSSVRGLEKSSRNKKLFKSLLYSATNNASIEHCTRSTQATFSLCLLHAVSYSYVSCILGCPCTSNVGWIAFFTTNLHTCLKHGSQRGGTLHP